VISAAAPGLDELAAPVVATPADRAFADLVREHFEDVVERHPVFASYLGLHGHDHRLPDLSRDAHLAGTAAERRFESALLSIDPAELSPATAFEREIALLTTRRVLFDDEVHRAWERRSGGAEVVGDSLFLLFARPFAPLVERLEAITERLVATPAALLATRDRLADRPVRLWLQLELDGLRSLPELLDAIVEAGPGAWGADDPRQRRLERASEDARAAMSGYAGWLEAQLPRGGDEFALGAADLETLIGLRAFDGLSGDDILALGEEQLAVGRRSRAQAAREMPGSPTEQEAVERVKSHHPATFDEALAGYRGVMDRARAFLVERELVTVPPDETLEVIPTPRYLRAVMPFAAYFAPAAFDRPRRGMYVVTPSVDGDPGAMREHNWGSISNTSLHEAYPGHHLQLTAALERPTLSRLLIEAPEFVEGWGMYSEILPREHGFDATPEHRVALATDAIWRACRIILDIRLHRGLIGVPEAIDLLVEQTGFERPNAAAEVHRYTSTPTYQMSYLLGRELILRLREDERRRLGDAFSLRRFHDALLWSGSLPVSFHRRLLRGEGGGPFLPAEGGPGSAPAR
jgi:uncharacterized protein (DUF885 family)